MTYEAVTGELRRAYDRAAGVRDAMPDAAWKQAERERFRSLLRAAGATTLLEVGAGHGVSGRYFADQGLDVVCVDLSPELVARCRAKGLTAYARDFLHLDFPAGSFDAVFAMNCLLHVPPADLPRVLVAVRDVLAAGGLFYWGQYGGFESVGSLTSDDYVPKRFFSLLTDEQIRTQAADAFEVIEFRTVAIPGQRPEFHYQALTLRPLPPGR